jgi:hypothetical protein
LCSQCGCCRIEAMTGIIRIVPLWMLVPCQETETHYLIEALQHFDEELL